MQTEQSKLAILRTLTQQLGVHCPTHPLLVEEALHAIGCSRTIVEVHADRIVFQNETVATTETIATLWRTCPQPVKNMIRGFLANMVLSEYQLKCVDRLHFENPFLSRMDSFSTDFLLGLPYQRTRKTKYEREVKKHYFESRINMERDDFNHFWIKRYDDTLYLRHYAYSWGIFKQVVQDNLLEVIPGTEHDMKREEEMKGWWNTVTRPGWVTLRSFKLTEGHALRDELEENNRTYKVRVRQLETNHNLRADIAPLGIETTVRLKNGVEQFLSLVPPRWLLNITYDQKKHSFSLFGIHLHQFPDKVKIKKAKPEGSVVQVYPQYLRPAKRQRLVRLPEQTPVTNAPVIAVDDETLTTLFPNVPDLMRVPDIYPRRTDPRTCPTWTGRVRKTRSWEMEVQVATGQKAYVPYSAWKKNSTKANRVRTGRLPTAAESGNIYPGCERAYPGCWMNGFVSREHADAGVIPFEF